MNDLISFGLITIGIAGLIGLTIERIYAYHLGRQIKPTIQFEAGLGFTFGALAGINGMKTKTDP